jgi:hypothetical protein
LSFNFLKVIDAAKILCTSTIKACSKSLCKKHELIQMNKVDEERIIATQNHLVVVQ